MSYLGDIRLGDTIDFKFCTTAASTGAPTTLAGTPVISAYPGNSTTQLTAGITLTVDFDGVTGLHNVRVVASSGNGYATATNYEMVITTGTVGGTSAVGYVVGTFSIENRSAVMPTTAARTLDISSTGEAGLDINNIAALTAGPLAVFGIIDSGTAQSATGTTLVIRSAASFADSELVGATVVITGGTGVGQRRLITANVGSTDTLTVDTWTTTPSGTITYEIFGSPPASSSTPIAANMTQIAGQTASASGTVTFPNATLASTTNITAGTITTATNLTNAPTSGDLTATMKTSVTTAATAATPTAAAVTGAVGSVTGNVGGNVVGTVAGVTPASATSINATRYQKNTASQKVFFTLVDSTDHVTRKTGITVTATRSLDGAAFGSATGTVTEVGSGVYYLSTSTADINADDIVFRFTGTACDPVELHVVTY